MALTKAQVREILSAAGVDSEHMGDAVEKIIDGHIASVNALREEIDRYKADAGKLAEVQKELDAAQAELSEYKAIKEDFEGFKAEQAKKESHMAKEAAYRELLKTAGVSERRIKTVLKVSDVDGVELTDKGEIKGADKLAASIKEEWADFIETTEVKGADTPNPLINTGGAMTRSDIFKTDDKGRYVMDATDRQRAIAENIGLFRKE